MNTEIEIRNRICSARLKGKTVREILEGVELCPVDVSFEVCTRGKELQIPTPEAKQQVLEFIASEEDLYQTLREDCIINLIDEVGYDDVLKLANLAPAFIEKTLDTMTKKLALRLYFLAWRKRYDAKNQT